MSKKRLIPKLQLKRSAGKANQLVLVVTKQFDNVIEIGNPVSQAKIFQAQLADELIFINIEREFNDINLLAEVINKVSEEIFMPITVGGGVNTVDDFRTLLCNGADKISINTMAVRTPELITSASEKYGAQCVVVSIDYKRNNEGNYKVYIEGGLEETSLNPLEWALKAESLGAGELLLCNIDRDGMRSGLDVEMTKLISSSVNIPVITSGGCGLSVHFVEGFLDGNADAVSAGSFFAHRDQNFMQTRSQIKNHGVNIRMYT